MKGVKSYEYLIALRYLRAKRRIGLISIISIISVCGIAVGVAALIIVLSVFNGFNSFAIQQLVGFDPHLRITPINQPTINADSLIATLKIDGILSLSPFISGRTAIIHNNVTQVAQIRGIRPDTEMGAIADQLSDPLLLDSQRVSDNRIVLGSILAQRLDVIQGDEVSIIGREGLELALTQVAQPTTIPVLVAGTFTLNQEYDEHIGFTTIQTARELFDLGDGEMGIDIRLDNYEDAEQEAVMLRNQLGDDYLIETWQDLHRDLYGAMELERWAAFAILMLIVIVAVFNVLGSLTMTVIEKRRDIGILKSMGASDSGIRNVYLFEGSLIGLIGTAIGVILGIGLCLTQQHFSLVKLDTTSYLLPAIPVEIHLLDILLVMITAMVLAAGAALYPATRASHVNPADAIRWE